MLWGTSGLPVGEPCGKLAFTFGEPQMVASFRLVGGRGCTSPETDSAWLDGGFREQGSVWGLGEVPKFGKQISP